MTTEPLSLHNINEYNGKRFCVGSLYKVPETDYVDSNVNNQQPHGLKL